MKVVKNETFYRQFDRGDKLIIEDIELEGCTFKNSGISMTTDLKGMTIVNNVQIEDCLVDSCETGPVILRNINITNLHTTDLFIVWCPYLDHVTISGEVGKIKINATADPSTHNNVKQQPFDDFRKQFYDDVEWALDISAARFKDFDIRGVPGRLIRRDPESQVLITRERALQVATPGWERQLDSSNKLWPFVVNLFLGDGDEDTVLVAPLGAAKAKRDPLLKGLAELRAIGLAEPN